MRWMIFRRRRIPVNYVYLKTNALKITIYIRISFQGIVMKRILISAQNEPQKVCNRCGLEKELTEFYRNRSKGNLYINRQCKDCKNKQQKKSYRGNLEGIREQKKIIARNRRTETKTKLLKYLSEHSCVDCGEDNPVVLEFDHIEEKKLSISQMQNYKWESVLEEINKCLVRCANCHRIKTSKELGWYRIDERYRRGLKAESKPTGASNS